MEEIADCQQFPLLKVPRAGVEPARVAPLVFETSASTDSAIWAAFAGAKVIIKIEMTKLSAKNLKNTCKSHIYCLPSSPQSDNL